MGFPNLPPTSEKGPSSQIPKLEMINMLPGHRHHDSLPPSRSQHMGTYGRLPMDMSFPESGGVNLRSEYWRGIEETDELADYPRPDEASRLSEGLNPMSQYGSSSAPAPVPTNASSFHRVSGVQHHDAYRQVHPAHPAYSAHPAHPAHHAPGVQDYVSPTVTSSIFAEAEEDEEGGDWKIDTKIKVDSFTLEHDTTQTLNNIAETIFASGRQVPQVDHELLKSDLFRTAEDLINKSFFSHFVDTIANRLPFIPDEVKIEPVTETAVVPRSAEPPSEDAEAGSSSSSSILQLQPKLKFTVEELKLLDEMKDVHDIAMNCVVRLGTNKLMVDTMMGSVTRMQLFQKLAAGKGLQTYNFMKVCKGLPHFKDLTLHAQRTLVTENMGICWELRNAAFFWGHTAQNIIEQEEQTGISINMKTYILSSRPDALALPPMNYDFYYSAPWMAVTDAQKKHKSLSREVGNTLKGLDVRLFPLLFAISLYNLDESSESYKNFTTADIETIKRVQQRLLIIYKRFIKHQVGWKRASHILLTQICLLVKLKQTVAIFIREKMKSAAAFKQMSAQAAQTSQSAGPSTAIESSLSARPKTQEAT